MLKIDRLTFSYDESEVKAVDNLSLNVAPGEICALLGLNGAGKTTTIKLILGLLRADSGTISINGKHITSDSIDYKKSIGYVSDNHEIYDCLTGKEYLNFIADSYEVCNEVRNEKYDKLITAFSLKPYIQNPIRSYSHGMKQKISIIASLVNNPLLWILDEPMTGLDVESNYILKQLILEHAKSGNIVLFSTHILEICERLCNKIAIIDKGKLILEKNVDHVNSFKSESLEQIFLEATKNGQNIKAY